MDISSSEGLFLLPELSRQMWSKGCENSNIDVLKNYIGDYDPKRVRFLVAQESEDEIADAHSRRSVRLCWKL